MSSQIGGLSTAAAEAQLFAWPDPAAPIAAEEYAERLDRARRLMHAAGADALLITAGASLRYFSGITWAPSERLVALLVTNRGMPIVICPAFEAASLAHVVAIPAEPRLWEEHESPYALVAAALVERECTTLALDPAAPFAVFEALQAALRGAAIVSATAIVDGCRMCKSPAELALMKQATAMTLKAQRLAAGILFEGITTTALKQFFDRAHRALGADSGSTFCIVQFGAATSHPHGIPGEQRLRTGDLVLIDTGCSVHGYNSDITRTYVYGPPDAEQIRIWNLERAAQQAAFDAVRPGVRCESVDAAARAVLEAAGLGPGYRTPGLPHRTGHGCGLSVHESPYLVRDDHRRLEPGMCCSDEPMIVIPDRFGVRLEDHFYVTPEGAAWFTPPSPAIDEPFVT